MSTKTNILNVIDAWVDNIRLKINGELYENEYEPSKWIETVINVILVDYCELTELLSLRYNLLHDNEITDSNKALLAIAILEVIRQEVNIDKH